ncbi:hypothetical protein PTKIN_Ptkin01aG0266800 [Pterospermum kingtungense]
MLSGEFRRSPRIVELDARKAQARSRNKGNVIHKVLYEEELDKGQDVLKQKCRRKKVKVRTVQDLVINSVEYEVQKTDTGNDEDNLVNAAVVPSGAALPEKSKLELLLGILQRRDTQKYFADPVNAEEVEYYYDVIKEPMDFGTIAKKLNEGSYQTLEQFEHDVFLVSNNAMLFNASNTVYYRQARALKELATRLFHILKTDPENFETEAFIRRAGPGRRIKAEGTILNCNSNNKNNNTGIAARGHRAQNRVDDFEVDKRRTYRPWNLSENRSLISAVYNSPKQLKLDEKAGLGYVESVKRFAKGLGPTVERAAMKKVESYISEAMKVWNLNANRQLQGPEMQVPNVLASNIKVAPSFKVPSSTLGFQNISSDKMDTLSGFSLGGQASINNIMNTNNALNGVNSQPRSRVESLGNLQGKMIQSASRGSPPSLHLLGNSNQYQTLAGEAMDSPSSFWNGGKVSAVNNMGMNHALNKGKEKLENIMDLREKVLQPMRGDLDSGAVFKDSAANQSSGINLNSSFSNYDSLKGKLDFTALWNTKSNQKELGWTSMMLDAINMDNTVKTAGQASTWMTMQESTPTRNSSVSSTSWRPPSQLMTGLNSSQAIDYTSGIGSLYPGKGKEAIADAEGSRYINNVKQGGLFSDLYKPAEMGTRPLTEYCFPEQTKTPEMSSLRQQKGELDSLCVAPPVGQDWLANFPQEDIMRASSNASKHQRFQPQSMGESSSSSRAAADRYQKQPAQGVELPQWKWL